MLVRLRIKLKKQINVKIHSTHHIYNIHMILFYVITQYIFLKNELTLLFISCISLN